MYKEKGDTMTNGTDAFTYVEFAPQYASRVVELRRIVPSVDELVAEASDRVIQNFAGIFQSRAREVMKLLAYEIDRNERAALGQAVGYFMSPQPRNDPAKSADENARVPYLHRARDPFILNIIRGGTDPSQAFQEVFYRSGVITLDGSRQSGTYDATSGDINVAFGGIKPPEGYPEGAKFLERGVLAVSETMIATGGSSIGAVERIVEQFGFPEEFFFAAYIAAKPGVEKILERFPKSKVYAGAIREKLDDHAYVEEGCGDAGRHYNGPKRGLLR